MDESYNLSGKGQLQKSTYLLFSLYKVQKQAKPIFGVSVQDLSYTYDRFQHESGRERVFQRAGINRVSLVYIKLSSSSLKIYAYFVCMLYFNKNFTHNIDDDQFGK